MKTVRLNKTDGTTIDLPALTLRQVLELQGKWHVAARDEVIATARAAGITEPRALADYASSRMEGVPEGMSFMRHLFGLRGACDVFSAAGVNVDELAIGTEDAIEAACALVGITLTTPKTTVATANAGDDPPIAGDADATPFLTGQTS